MYSAVLFSTLHFQYYIQRKDPIDHRQAIKTRKVILVIQVYEK